MNEELNQSAEAASPAPKRPSRRGCLIWALLPVVLFGLGIGACVSADSYRFGLRERDYPQLFPGSGAANNRTMKHSAEYSWHTRLPTAGGGVVTAEHLVPATEEDLQRLDLPEGRYLFFSLQVEAPQLTAIEVAHSYAGVPLEVAGTYLYRRHVLESGAPDPARRGWKIDKLEETTIKPGEQFGYVRLYRVPSTARVSRFLPQSLWFPETLQERIEIRERALDGSETQTRFDFEATWHGSSSPFWRVLTVT